MSISNRYHVVEIADWLVSTLQSKFGPASPSGLGIIKTQFGSVAHLPTPSIPVGILPCIFVEPIDLDSIQGPPVTKISNYENFRIVYVRAFDDVDNMVRQKVVDCIRIANYIMDDFLLRNMPALSDGFGVYDGLINKMDFSPPEDAAALLTGENVSACALNFRVTEAGHRTG